MVIQLQSEQKTRPTTLCLSFSRPTLIVRSMTLQNVTNEVLRTVEEVTGRPVLVQPDPSLKSILAKVVMARGSAAAHLVTYNPSAGASADYAICSQCGFLLRTFGVPEQERFSGGGSSSGRKEAERLLLEHHKMRGRPLSKEVFSGLLERLFGGLILQLRSMPISVRVDAWIQRSYPELAEQQKKAIVRQLNDNSMSLKPEVREIAPDKIIQANIDMNAGFALFWSRAWNDPLLAVPYKSSGKMEIGEKLLRLIDEIPDDPAHDKQLIDSWGSHVGLNGWYEFLPYE